MMEKWSFYNRLLTGFPAGVKPEVVCAYHSKRFMVLTLQAQTHSATDLLQEAYEFINPAKFQSDPLEQRFLQYRQMSGGNFLVSIREVLNSKKTLLCKSLIKEGDGVLEEKRYLMRLSRTTLLYLKVVKKLQ